MQCVCACVYVWGACDIVHVLIAVWLFFLKQQFEVLLSSAQNKDNNNNNDKWNWLQY